MNLSKIFRNFFHRPKKTYKEEESQRKKKDRKKSNEAINYFFYGKTKRKYRIRYYSNEENSLTYTIFQDENESDENKINQLKCHENNIKQEMRKRLRFKQRAKRRNAICEIDSTDHEKIKQCIKERIRSKHIDTMMLM